jgi:hypothetical protein
MIYITKYNTQWELLYWRKVPNHLTDGSKERRERATPDNMNRGNSGRCATNWNQVTLDVTVFCSEIPWWLAVSVCAQTALGAVALGAGGLVLAWCRALDTEWSVVVCEGTGRLEVLRMSEQEVALLMTVRNGAGWDVAATWTKKRKIMKQTAFWREKNGACAACLKYSVRIFVD